MKHVVAGVLIATTIADTQPHIDAASLRPSVSGLAPQGGDDL
jgi:hypothetical protein